MGITSVLIFGKSLCLTGIGACLKLEKGLHVKLIDPEDPRAVQCLPEVNPDVILFDLGDPPDELDLRLLRKQPDWVLIGVAPSSDDLLMIKGQSNLVMRSGELSKLITNKTGPDVKSGS